MNTSIILIFSVLENFDERIKEINSFRTVFFGAINLISIHFDESEGSSVWYGGNKYMNQHILMAAYKGTFFDEFEKHLKNNVLWEEPWEVQVLVYDEAVGYDRYRLINIFDKESVE